MLMITESERSTSTRFKNTSSSSSSSLSTSWRWREEHFTFRQDDKCLSKSGDSSLLSLSLFYILVHSLASFVLPFHLPFSLSLSVTHIRSLADFHSRFTSFNVQILKKTLRNVVLKHSFPSSSPSSLRFCITPFLLFSNFWNRTCSTVSRTNFDLVNWTLLYLSSMISNPHLSSFSVLIDGTLFFVPKHCLILITIPSELQLLILKISSE